MNYKEFKEDVFKNYKRNFKRREMESELGHEDKLYNNNYKSTKAKAKYVIWINGRKWKPANNLNHAKAIVNTLIKKGKKAEYKVE